MRPNVSECNAMFTKLCHANLASRKKMVHINPSPSFIHKKINRQKNSKINSYVPCILLKDKNIGS